MKALRVLSVLLVYPLVCNVRAADPNVADYEKLCAVYNLVAAVAKFKDDKEEDKAGTILSEINFLNISVADQAFYDSGNLSRTEEKSNPSTSTEGWQAKKEKLSEKIAADGREKINARVQDSVFRVSAARQISLILKEAERHVQKYEDSRVKAAGDLSEAKQACEKAIFGKGAAKWGENENLDVGTFTDVSGNNAWSAASLGSGKGCGSTGGEKAGLSIISDLSCLCLGREGSSNTNGKESCGKAISVSNGAFDTNADALAAPTTGWGVIRKHCEKGAHFGGIPSQHDLERALQGYLRRIGIKEANKVGGGTGSTCTGGTTNQICVIYTHVMNGGDVTKIPWVEEVLKASAKVQNYADAKNEARKQLTNLETLNATAWAVFAGVREVKFSLNGETSRKDKTFGSLETVEGSQQRNPDAGTPIKTSEHGEPPNTVRIATLIGFLMFPLLL